uniref:Uncharacterized protein n=1 Tax=Chromera velia CCMP2878 TaxID=1169474 RepID=A0A0G4HPQ6_9ALVE|eukprot:Cvel_7794.t1-p1 / transcript=Cvel_7794.t1 / gene=Cvel_7794 / organism=Chromera_velia_CCMP2878 / gene_product=hypothetical protein / transcript_product=hypothetical protein / location=Cvel_scaffold415:66821-76919(+) / protein_length=2665 / sequence_SO=supercontig / SO=protein_coding / is_pseudo=false
MGCGGSKGTQAESPKDPPPAPKPPEAMSGNKDPVEKVETAKDTGTTNASKGAERTAAPVAAPRGPVVLPPDIFDESFPSLGLPSATAETVSLALKRMAQWEAGECNGDGTVPRLYARFAPRLKKLTGVLAGGPAKRTCLAWAWGASEGRCGASEGHCVCFSEERGRWPEDITRAVHWTPFVGRVTTALRCAVGEMTVKDVEEGGGTVENPDAVSLALSPFEEDTGGAEFIAWLLLLCGCWHRALSLLDRRQKREKKRTGQEAFAYVGGLPDDWERRAAVRKKIGDRLLASVASLSFLHSTPFHSSVEAVLSAMRAAAFSIHKKGGGGKALPAEFWGPCSGAFSGVTGLSSVGATDGHAEAPVCVQWAAEAALGAVRLLQVIERERMEEEREKLEASVAWVPSGDVGDLSKHPLLLLSLCRFFAQSHVAFAVVSAMCGGGMKETSKGLLGGPPGLSGVSHEGEAGLSDLPRLWVGLFGARRGVVSVSEAVRCLLGALESGQGRGGGGRSATAETLWRSGHVNALHAERFSRAACWGVLLDPFGMGVVTLGNLVQALNRYWVSVPFKQKAAETSGETVFSAFMEEPQVTLVEGGEGIGVMECAREGRSARRLRAVLEAIEESFLRSETFLLAAREKLSGAMGTLTARDHLLSSPCVFLQTLLHGGAGYEESDAAVLQMLVPSAVLSTSVDGLQSLQQIRRWMGRAARFALDTWPRVPVGQDQTSREGLEGSRNAKRRPGSGRRLKLLGLSSSAAALVSPLRPRKAVSGGQTVSPIVDKKSPPFGFLVRDPPAVHERGAHTERPQPNRKKEGGDNRGVQTERETRIPKTDKEGEEEGKGKSVESPPKTERSARDKEKEGKVIFGLGTVDPGGGEQLDEQPDTEALPRVCVLRGPPGCASASLASTAVVKLGVEWAKEAGRPTRAGGLFAAWAIGAPGEQDTNFARRLVKTWARQIAVRFPCYRERLLGALREGPGMVALCVKDHAAEPGLLFRTLIEKPLVAAARDDPSFLWDLGGSLVCLAAGLESLEGGCSQTLGVIKHIESLSTLPFLKVLVTEETEKPSIDDIWAYVVTLKASEQETRPSLVQAAASKREATRRACESAFDALKVPQPQVQVAAAVADRVIVAVEAVAEGGALSVRGLARLLAGGAIGGQLGSVSCQSLSLAVIQSHCVWTSGVKLDGQGRLWPHGGKREASGAGHRVLLTACLHSLRSSLIQVRMTGVSSAASSFPERGRAVPVLGSSSSKQNSEGHGMSLRGLEGSLNLRTLKRHASDKTLREKGRGSPEKGALPFWSSLWDGGRTKGTGGDWNTNGGGGNLFAFALGTGKGVVSLRSNSPSPSKSNQNSPPKSFSPSRVLPGSPPPPWVPASPKELVFSTPRTPPSRRLPPLTAGRGGLCEGCCLPLESHLRPHCLAAALMLPPFFWSEVGEQGAAAHAYALRFLLRHVKGAKSGGGDAGRGGCTSLYGVSAEDATKEIQAFFVAPDTPNKAAGGSFLLPFLQGVLFGVCGGGAVPGEMREAGSAVGGQVEGLFASCADALTERILPTLPLELITPAVPAPSSSASARSLPDLLPAALWWQRLSLQLEGKLGMHTRHALPPSGMSASDFLSAVSDGDCRGDSQDLWAPRASPLSSVRLDVQAPAGEGKAKQLLPLFAADVKSVCFASSEVLFAASLDGSIKKLQLQQQSNSSGPRHVSVEMAMPAHAGGATVVLPCPAPGSASTKEKKTKKKKKDKEKEKQGEEAQAEEGNQEAAGGQGTEAPPSQAAAPAFHFSGGRDGVVRQWDSNSGAEWHSLTVRAPSTTGVRKADSVTAISLCWGPEQEGGRRDLWIASATISGLIAVWRQTHTVAGFLGALSQPSAPEMVSRFCHGAAVSLLSNTAKKGSNMGLPFAWSLALVAPLQPDKAPLVLSGGDDGLICCRRGVGTEVLPAFCGHKGSVYCLAVEEGAGDGVSLVASGGADGVVNFWKVAQGSDQSASAGREKGKALSEEEPTTSLSVGEAVRDLKFFVVQEEGKQRRLRVAACLSNGTVVLLRVSQSSLWTWKRVGGSQGRIETHGGFVWSLGAVPVSGGLLAAVGGQGGMMYLMHHNIEKEKDKKEGQTKKAVGSLSVGAACFSQDGRLLFTGDTEGGMAAFALGDTADSLTSCTPQWVVEGAGGIGVEALACSWSGNWLAASAESGSSIMLLCYREDEKDMKIIRNCSPASLESKISRLEMAGCGGVFAGVSDEGGGMQVWFPPDGVVVTAPRRQGATLPLVQTQKGTPETPHSLAQTEKRERGGSHGSPTALAFSFDGCLLVSASAGTGVVDLWRVEGVGGKRSKGGEGAGGGPSLSLMRSFWAHLGGVGAVALGPAERILATGGQDGAAKLWLLENILRGDSQSAALIEVHSAVAKDKSVEKGEQTLGRAGTPVVQTTASRSGHPLQPLAVALKPSSSSLSPLLQSVLPSPPSLATISRLRLFCSVCMGPNGGRILRTRLLGVSSGLNPLATKAADRGAGLVSCEIAAVLGPSEISALTGDGSNWRDHENKEGPVFLAPASNPPLAPSSSTFSRLPLSALSAGPKTDASAPSASIAAPGSVAVGIRAGGGGGMGPSLFLAAPLVHPEYDTGSGKVGMSSLQLVRLGSSSDVWGVAEEQDGDDDFGWFGQDTKGVPRTKEDKKQMEEKGGWRTAAK